MKKQSIAGFGFILFIGVSLLFASCQAPVLTQGSLSDAKLSLSFSGGMANLGNAAPGGSGAARWLNPGAQFVRAVLFDSMGNTVASGQGNLVSNNGSKIFQLMGVKPGSGLTLKVELYQNATSGNLLGTATVSDFSIKAGQNPPIAISVVPHVPTTNIFNSLDGGIQVGNGLIEIYALHLNTSVTGGELKCLEANISGVRCPIITVLDSEGRTIGQCFKGCMDNRVAFWVNPNENPETYYIVVDTRSFITGSVMLQGSSDSLPRVNITSDYTEWDIPYSDENLVGQVTYQFLLGFEGSKDISKAMVIEDKLKLTTLKCDIGANQTVWVKYRVGEALIGLLGATTGYR